MNKIKLRKYDSKPGASMLDPTTFSNLISGKTIVGASWQLQLEFIEIELSDKSRIRFRMLVDGPTVAYVTP